MNAAVIILSLFFLLGNTHRLIFPQSLISPLDVGILIFIGLSYVARFYSSLNKKGRKLKSFPTWILNQVQDDGKKYSSIFGPFVIVCVVSLVISLIQLPLNVVLISSLYLVRFILYSFLFQIIGSSSVNKIHQFSIFYALGIVLAIGGYAQLLFYPNLRNLYYLGWDPHEYRIFGTIFDPNFMGLLFSLFVLVGVLLYLHKKQRFILLSAFFIGIACILTFSRGSILAMGLSVSYFFFATKLPKKFLLFGFIALFMTGAWMYGMSEGTNLLRTISIQARIDNTVEGILLFEKYPLFGVGFNTLRYIRHSFINPSSVITLPNAGAGFHNSYIFILTTTGIFGTAAYLYSWFRIIRLSNKIPKLYQHFIISVIIAVGVHAFFDNSLFFPWVMCLVYGILGSAVTIRENT